MLTIQGPGMGLCYETGWDSAALQFYLQQTKNKTITRKTWLRLRTRGIYTVRALLHCENKLDKVTIKS